jgi:CheY-like chemotaxis protein
VPSRVLVADDDRAIRESLARALELEGYDVATVADGVETLTRVRRDDFDALVVDVMMPGVDGDRSRRDTVAAATALTSLSPTTRPDDRSECDGSAAGAALTSPSARSSGAAGPRAHRLPAPHLPRQTGARRAVAPYPVRPP